MTRPGAGLLEDLLARAGDPESYEAWWIRGRATGWCRHPVRLVGATRHVDNGTGEVRGEFASAALPDGVLLKACQQRRATLCPTCSATYRADAFHLVSAGLRGGKGVPETVVDHPAVFATLTAPAFGAVHSAAKNRDGQPHPCHPAGTGACEHGTPRACVEMHEPGDPLLGQAICGACFDYPRAVVWNALAGDLWRRTTIGLRRRLARHARLPASRLNEAMSVSFAKVVEYQRRGVVHVHAVIRVDPAGNGPASLDGQVLALAVIDAATSASVPYPDSPGLTGRAGWGSQLDVQVLGHTGLSPGGAAGYLAKYVTKSTDPAGLLDRRLRVTDLDHLDALLSPHLARMVRTAWDLGGRPELAHLRLRAWAHTLGFRGHWLTKSRSYSTTFAALRAARAAWSRDYAVGDEPAPHDLAAVRTWSYAGRGWVSPGDAWLAEAAAAELAETRLLAREARRTDHRQHI